MALHQLLSMIPHEVAQPRRSVLARWTETPEMGSWDPEPAYGAFIDEQSRVVSGNRPSRAFLETDDPRQLVLSSETLRKLGPNVSIVFLDWGRQTVLWEEIFELWETWESSGLIVDCGAVSVLWSVASRWTAPGWVAFANGFDGQPLTATPILVREQEIVRPPTMPVPERVSYAASHVTEDVPKRATAVPTSFLARAKKLKGESDAMVLEAPLGGSLPMLPFTLHSLKDSNFAWPQGVA